MEIKNGLEEKLLGTQGMRYDNLVDIQLKSQGHTFDSRNLLLDDR